MASNCSRVRVCEEEFLAAKTNGCVYGEMFVGTVTAYVYVELGKERKYIPHRKDDLNASYRIFFNSTIYYAKTANDINEHRY